MADAVKLREVRHVYDATTPIVALDHLSLSIETGEYVAVVGPSGCGKSTLLNLIGVLDTPTSGIVEVLGVDTRTLDDRQASHLRSDRIGFVFQAFHLIASRSISENVALPLKYSPRIPRHERQRRALECLSMVGLAHREGARPLQLSGGEQQRTAMARALVARPTLLLCDEPTGNLDAATTESVLDMIDELRRRAELTVIVATHDPAVSDRSDRVVRFSASGAHDG